jgi:hypothetical protein
MPYINQTQRDFMEHHSPTSAGELNYCLTSLCIEYLNQSKGRYQDYNDIMGALEGCKLEFYRRKVAPYENLKMLENGDVYE